MKLLKITGSLAFIIALNFICQRLVSFFHISFPAPLIAMVLLSVLMYFKIIPIDFIESGAVFLLDNIGLFFVSLIVGAFVYMPVIKNDLPVILAVFITTSVFLILLAGITTQYFLSRRVCKEKNEGLNDDAD